MTLVSARVPSLRDRGRPGRAALPSDDDRLVAITVALGALILGAVAASLTISGSSSEYARLEGLARALMVGAPIAVGLYAVRRPPSQRIGALLILAGFCWFLTPEVAVFTHARVV